MVLPYGLSISGDEISSWADRIEAAGALPQVVRRLILATTPTSAINFRADGGTRYSGWDGIVVANDGGPFVPAGASFWELSTSSGTASKLDKDFAKRSREPHHAVPPVSATYVAVTARRFVGKAEWAQRKVECGPWAGVRCFDADDLATWFDTALAAATWFAAAHLDRPTPDLSSAEEYLKEWTDQTEPPLPARLHLLGSARASAAQTVQQWLLAPSAPLMVRAETSEQARQFVVAALIGLSEEQGSAARSLVVRSESAFRWALRQPGSARLILIPTFDAPRVQSPHHIAFTLGPSRAGAAHISLGPVPYRLLEPELASAGLEHVERIARESGGSLAALPRLCGAQSSSEPAWLRDPSPALTALVLVGAWDPRADGDRETVAALARSSHVDVDILCADLSGRPEVPIRLHHGRHASAHWRWTSRADAWESLAPGISQSVLREFRDQAIRALKEEDPVYSLPHDQRLYAGIQGKVRRHSPEIREGIVETLCRLSLSDAVLAALPGGAAGSSFASGVVRELLSENWLGWASLSDVLPQLAEAAPREFLDATERSLALGSQGVVHLFTEESEWTSPHTGLLWALERLAWSSDRMPRVASLLARLAETDTGGRLANRPSASLHRLLHPFLPSTNAPIDERLDALQELHRRQPAFAWQFTLGLAESLNGGIALPAAKPEYLPELCEERTVTGDDVDKFVEVVTSLLLTAAGRDTSRWVELLSGRRLPWDTRLPFLMAAKRLVAAGELCDDEHLLWTALREPIHLAYLQCKDGSDEQLELLRELYQQLLPTDLVARFSWLFSPHAEVPEPCDGWREEQQRLTILQEEALDALLACDDALELLRVLSKTVGYPTALGIILGNSKHADKLEDWLLGASEDWRLLRPGFFAARAHSKGGTWATDYLSSLVRSDRLAEATESALLLPRVAETWDSVEKVGDELRDSYWRSDSFAHPQAAADTERAVTELERVGASAKAVDVAGAHPGDVSIATILRVLTATAFGSAELSRADPMRAYHVQKLFERLHLDRTVDENELVKLELAYLGWLTSPSARAPPLRLFRALAEQPELFAQLVSMLYRRRVDASEASNEVEDADDGSNASLERRRNSAAIAYHVLGNWKDHPGLGSESPECEAALLAWSRSVLDLTEKDGRREVGEIEVTRVLARAPAGPDGIWPCAAARILAGERGPDFVHGLAMAKRNLRGVVRKELYEGGRQERDIEKRYRESAAKLRGDVRWSAAAALLEEMANYYEREAAAEDARARSEKLQAGED